MLREPFNDVKRKFRPLERGICIDDDRDIDRISNLGKVPFDLTLCQREVDL